MPLHELDVGDGMWEETDADGIEEGEVPVPERYRFVSPFLVITRALEIRRASLVPTARRILAGNVLGPESAFA